MNRRSSAPIKQQLPEVVCAVVPEAWLRDLIGAVVVALVILFLIFFLGPAIQAGME